MSIVGLPRNDELCAVSKKEIDIIKRKLNSLGFSVGKCGADGSYGGDTVKAVTAYQKSTNGKLEVDGKAGRKTLTSLGFECVW